MHNTSGGVRTLLTGESILFVRTISTSDTSSNGDMYVLTMLYLNHEFPFDFNESCHAHVGYVFVPVCIDG